MDCIAEGQRVFDYEIEGLKHARQALGDSFVQIANEIAACKGKVIITGIGKSGHVGRKISSTLSSLGTPAIFLHPAEAQHGDLGMVSNDDVVIAISNSGESDEVVRIIPNIRIIGSKLFSITKNANSTLAKNSDIVQIIPDIPEADPLGLAPTTSTTITLAIGDALSIVVSRIYGFTEADFAGFHPSGSLGRKLACRVCDIMHKTSDIIVINRNSCLKDAVVAISYSRLGIVVIMDGDVIAGVITDGDIRRLLERGIDIYSMSVNDSMTIDPKTLESDCLAIQALQMMKSFHIEAMPVTDREGNLAGVIHIQDLIGAGIIV